MPPASLPPTPDPGSSRSPDPSASGLPAAGGAGIADGGGDAPPGAGFSVSGTDSASSSSAAVPVAFGDSLSQFTALFGRAFDWAVPGLILSVPGLLLVLAIVAQAIGALAWLPLVRRRIGGFGLRFGRTVDRTRGA